MKEKERERELRKTERVLWYVIYIEGITSMEGCVRVGCSLRQAVFPVDVGTLLNHISLCVHSLLFFNFHH